MSSASLSSWDQDEAHPKVLKLQEEMRLAYMANDWHRLRKKTIKLATLKPCLNIEERFFLAASQENINFSLQDSLRELDRTGVASLSQDRRVVKAVFRSYRDDIAKELSATCQSLLNLLLSYLIPRAVDDEAKVDYLRMKGAQHLVLGQVSGKQEEFEWARLAYASAWTKAQALPVANVSRLSAANSLSHFLFHQQRRPDFAEKILRETFEAAEGSTDVVIEANNDPMFPVAAHLLGVMRYNFKTWTSTRTSSVCKSALRGLLSRLSPPSRSKLNSSLQAKPLKCSNSRIAPSSPQLVYI